MRCPRLNCWTVLYGTTAIPEPGAYRRPAETSAYRGSAEAAAHPSTAYRGSAEAAALSKSPVRDQGRQKQGSSSNKPKLFHGTPPSSVSPPSGYLLSRADIERDIVRLRSVASVVLDLASLALVLASVQPPLAPASVQLQLAPASVVLASRPSVARAEDGAGAGQLPLASALARRMATPTTRRITLILASFGMGMRGSTSVTRIRTTEPVAFQRWLAQCGRAASVRGSEEVLRC
jgi:hypothetical protein